MAPAHGNRVINLSDLHIGGSQSLIYPRQLPNP